MLAQHHVVASPWCSRRRSLGLRRRLAIASGLPGGRPGRPLVDMIETIERVRAGYCAAATWTIMPPIEAPTMCAVEAERLHEADRVGRHVLHQIRRVDLLAGHQLLIAVGEVGTGPRSRSRSRGRCRDCRSARRKKPSCRQPVAESVGPHGELRAQAHDQQDRGIALRRPSSRTRSRCRWPLRASRFLRFRF